MPAARSRRDLALVAVVIGAIIAAVLITGDARGPFAVVPALPWHAWRQGRGQCGASGGRIDEWVAERLAAHRQMHGTHEQELSDGRWLRVEERRTADGGSIGVRVDITELKKSERSVRLLFESNPVPLYVV